MIDYNDRERVAALAEDVLYPLSTWAKDCHVASLELVKRGVGKRVARGTSLRGVMGQHSWVATCDDCYDQDAIIIDPTLWSYFGQVPHVKVCTLKESFLVPHGSGSIWSRGMPQRKDGMKIISLYGEDDLSKEAADFLDMIGPLDFHGWMMLANSPVGGSPAAEILSAIEDTELLSGIVPIDILGMITDRNPGGLYW